MHEMSIAVNIFEVVERHLPKEQNTRVKKIFLRAGKLAAIYPLALETCMKAISRNTPVEGAELVINEVPIQSQCRSCGAVTEFDEPPFICAMCGGAQLDIISGRELFVESIEVE
jgi:hydrogenase nickel incorporation protein HypA/HybF